MIGNRFQFLALTIGPGKFFIRNTCSIDKLRLFHRTPIMANSKWEYVKSYELDDTLLPNCWIVARIDGRGFHKLAKKHNWKRPNDTRALALMNHSAKLVMDEYEDIVLGYGQSDEFSFIFRKSAQIFQRRSSKIITTVVSKFSSCYVYNWNKYFTNEVLQYPPSFDGRIILYPTDQNLRDYLNWRQADCHINNLYNTTFWSLVQQGGLSTNEADKKLCGTLSGDKNEILFSEFGINYNKEPELFRKGTVLVAPKPSEVKKGSRKSRKAYAERMKSDQGGGIIEDATEKLESISLSSTETKNSIDEIIELNCDIIQDQFWNDYPYLLNRS